MVMTWGERFECSILPAIEVSARINATCFVKIDNWWIKPGEPDFTYCLIGLLFSTRIISHILRSVRFSDYSIANTG
jgi:hypothetical protein